MELRIKSIKYFDLDSTIQPQNKPNVAPPSTDELGHSLPGTLPTGAANLSQQGANRSNTTKSFNIEGLTVYFDEFIIKDEVDAENLTAAYNEPTTQIETGVDTEDQASLLDSTHSLSSLNNTDSSFSKPTDEAQPFNYELNPDYYLYTNPVIFITFSGIQTIKLTINNMKPSDMIEAAVAANSGEAMTKSMTQSQRPLMELSAQFGSIKCLLCPKQVHLMTDMVTKVTDYVNDANAVRKAKHLRRLSYLKSSKKAQRGGGVTTCSAGSGASGFAKPVRGCDKRKYEALIQNNLGNQETNLDILLNEEDEGEDDEVQFGRSSLSGQSDNEQSVMFYSMMSESTAFNNSSANTVNNINMSNLSNSFDSTNIDGKYEFLSHLQVSKLLIFIGYFRR